MKTPVISFYSDIEGRTYYSDHSVRLSKNLTELNIPHYIRHRPSKGSYRSNCLSKPRFILEMMNELRCPLVWLDVDSIVHKELTVFDELADKVDLAFTSPKTPSQENNNIDPPKASPIFLNNTPKAYEFIYSWIHFSEEVEHSTNVAFDHEILVGMFKKILEHNSGYRVAILGNAYCVWPGINVIGEAMITMGLADAQSKQDVLRKMGFDENSIQFQSPGNKFLVNK
jgi:hypothetical protein